MNHYYQIVRLYIQGMPMVKACKKYHANWHSITLAMARDPSYHPSKKWQKKRHYQTTRRWNGKNKKWIRKYDKKHKKYFKNQAKEYNLTHKARVSRLNHAYLVKHRAYLHKRHHEYYLKHKKYLRRKQHGKESSKKH